MELAPIKPDKGDNGGSCNRRSCQAPGATWYNHSTRRHYCPDCAELINIANRGGLGHDLCTYDGPCLAVNDIVGLSMMVGLAESFAGDLHPRLPVKVWPLRQASNRTKEKTEAEKSQKRKRRKRKKDTRRRRGF